MRLSVLIDARLHGLLNKIQQQSNRDFEGFYEDLLTFAVTIYEEGKFEDFMWFYNLSRQQREEGFRRNALVEEAIKWLGREDEGAYKNLMEGCKRARIDIQEILEVAERKQYLAPVQGQLTEQCQTWLTETLMDNGGKIVRSELVPLAENSGFSQSTLDRVIRASRGMIVSNPIGRSCEYRLMLSPPAGD